MLPGVFFRRPMGHADGSRPCFFGRFASSNTLGETCFARQAPSPRCLVQLTDGTRSSQSPRVVAGYLQHTAAAIRPLPPALTCWPPNLQVGSRPALCQGALQRRGGERCRRGVQTGQLQAAKAVKEAQVFQSQEAPPPRGSAGGQTRGPSEPHLSATDHAAGQTLSPALIQSASKRDSAACTCGRSAAVNTIAHAVAPRQTRLSPCRVRLWRRFAAAASSARRLFDPRPPGCARQLEAAHWPPSRQ